jgi:serine/threonine protein kinase
MLDSLDDIYIQAKSKEKKEDKFEVNSIAFIHFLKCALTLDPTQRWTAKMLLFHPFIQDTDMQTLSMPQIECIRKESIETTSSYENVHTSIGQYSPRIMPHPFHPATSQ